MNRYKIIFLFLIVLISCNSEKEQKIRIAVAANMQFAMEEMIKEFTTKTGIACELIASSSGKHTAQILKGAPYDIFVAADKEYPEKVYQSGLSKNPPKIYAYGQLILWSMDTRIEPSMALLTDPKTKHIALANPKIAPYGAAAEQVMKHYHLYKKVADKLVYGESIAQTNQFITSKAAQMGFTAQSTVLAPAIKGKGNWILLPKNSYQPIEQAVVWMHHNKDHEEQIKQFYTFLFSSEAQKIIKNFGYLVP